MAHEPYTLTARWIFPVDQMPLPRGTITIQGDRILSVDKAGTRAAHIDLGNVAILPGFVNAHTHLDLSDALGQCPPTPDFTAWLRAVIAHRRRQTPEDVARAIDMGLAQSLRYGTTLVGDITAGGMSWERLAGSPLRAVVFYELLGLSEERAKITWENAVSWLKTRPHSEKTRPGFSPHAPYSVHRHLLERAARLAAEENLPLTMHLAETEAEIELLKSHTGPLVPFLKEMGVWNAEGLEKSAQGILETYGENETFAFVHGNYLDTLTPFSKAPPIIFCPRTHAAFGHKTHPFRDFLAQGIPVALGTDSLASNPDLDMLQEMRFLHEKNPDVPGPTVLKMATWNGALALGWANETGSISPGKSADLVILPLPEHDPADPHAMVFESSIPVKAVMFRGDYATETGVRRQEKDGGTPDS
jgi:cytosine/adenosine deaminase-related metal-dependent hydrolase